MKLVVREHVNHIAEVTKKVFSVSVSAIDNYGKLSAGIGLMKGDMIVYRGNGDPVRLPVGTTGKVLTADPTQPEGVRWSDAGGGGAGATTVLHNASGVQITTGTILYVLPSDQLISAREAIKAFRHTEGRLYIAREDTAANQDVDCYGIPGTIAQVLVTGSCALGDALVVSDTSGVAEALADGEPTVGIAMETKSSSAVGLVTTLLVENKAVRASNADSASHIAGTVYALNGGYGTDGLGTIYPKVKPAKNGQRPYGVQANSQSLSNTLTLLHAKPGETAVAIADTTEIRVGDWLVPSATTPGQVRNGNGYGIGTALEAKASGASGKIKIRMYPSMYGFSPRAWWLPSGITEDQVIAAWQFVNMLNEASALINVNEGTEYALTKSGDTVTWNGDKGFYIPASNNAGLHNSALFSVINTQLMSASFGYTELDINGDVFAGGINGSTANNSGIALCLSPTCWDGGGSNAGPKAYTISRDSNPRSCKTGTITSSGVVGGDFTTLAIYDNGVSKSITKFRDYIRGSKVLLGQKNLATNKSFYFTAVAFYNTVLTAEQHAELAENITALGGI